MDRRNFLIGSAGLASSIPTLGFPVALAQGKRRSSKKRGNPKKQLSRDESLAIWKKRVRGILARDKLPIIDIQATYVARKTSVPDMIRHMKELDVAQIAFAAAGARTSEPSLALHRNHPEFFIPVTNSGEFRRWWKNPQKFLSGVANDLETGAYFLMGEYEFRHYPSPEQVKAGRSDRDITIELDGPAGHELFQLSEKTGVAFQIHYEIEEGLFPALESMLERYPKAKVIWCHLAMIRYPDRAGRFNPDYVASLIERFSGLHFDLAVPAARHVYKPSGARDSTIYTPSGALEAKWRAIIEKYPDRFLAAGDYRPPVENKYPTIIRRQRKLINALSEQVRPLVAYQNAWRLLSGKSWA